MDKEEDKKGPLTVFFIGRVAFHKHEEWQKGPIQRILESVPQIEECYEITGEWDVIFKYRVKDMDEYYKITWTIGKYLERGWGAIVSKTHKEGGKVFKG
jgi:DNA-binding Lrp family transcriptional regulator